MYKEPVWIELYCENSDCPVRQLTLFAKHDEPEDERTLQSVMSCPLCGSFLKEHWRRSLSEQESIDNIAAIGTVNASLYRREHPDEFGIPMNVMVVNKLPEIWKAV